MEVFLIPVGGDRYELYCEVPDEEPEDAPEVPRGFFRGLMHSFRQALAEAERERRRAPRDAHDDEHHQGRNWYQRVKRHTLRRIAESIAEQRLLWNLRRRTTAVAAHPPGMPFEQVLTLIRRTLQRDYERHRLWLVIDTIFLVASGALMLVPGPNVIAYYFAFRVVGHWLSMRGASQGLHRVTWTCWPCPPLDELRELAVLDPPAREHRLRDVAERLRLPYLSAFFDRVAIHHA